MNTIRSIAVGLTIAALVLLPGCGASKTVERVDPNAAIDLSGEWNDTDSRLVADEMINDLLARPWFPEFKAASSGRPPVVIVGTVRNRTDEHIQTTAFIRNLERDLINSGKVEFVANKEERQEVREERADQQENATDETVKRFKQETGADFMLSGDITSIVDREEGAQVRYYQVNLQLLNLETNRKVWLGEKKIKKFISRSGAKF